MRIDILTLCKSASYDENNLLTIVSPTSRIGYRAVPNQLRGTVFVRLIFDADDEGDTAMDFKIIGPDGEVVAVCGEQSTVLELRPDEGFGIREIVLPTTCTIPSFGDYQILAMINGHEFSTLFRVWHSA